jgi:hypothetical protein
MKLDSNGNIQWQKTYGGPGQDLAYDVEETQDGGYIVGGGTGSFGAGGWDMWILKLDSHGNVQWQKTYGGWGVGIDGLNAEYVDNLLQTSDGGYIVVGGTTSYGAGEEIFGFSNLIHREMCSGKEPSEAHFLIGDIMLCRPLMVGIS